MSNHHNLERKRIHDYERMSPHDLSTLSALVENETYVNRNKRHTLSRGMKICRRRVKQVLGVREEDKRLHDAIQAHRDEDAQRNGPVQIYRSAVPKESFFSNDYDYYGSPFGSGHRSPPAQQATPTRGSGELPEQGTPEDKIIYNDAYDRGKNDFSQMNGYHSAREKTEIAKDGYDDGFFGKPRRHFHMETRHIQQKPSLQQAAAQRHQSRAPEQKTSNPRQERYDFGYANGRSDWMNGSSNRSHVFHDEDEVRGYLAGYDGECPETIPAEPARGSGAAAEKVEALSPHDFYMHWYRTGQEDSRNGTSHTTDTAEKRIPYSAGYWGDPCEPPPQTLPTSRDRGETQSGLTERERYDRGYDKGVKDDLQNRPLNVDQFSDLQEIEGYKDAYYGNVRGTNFVRGKEASEGSESLTEIALFVRGYLAGVAGSAGVDHSSRIENPVERFGYQDGRKYGRKYEIVSISSFEQN